MKKVLEKAELPGETTVLMHSPPDTRVLECHEEFYDAIMAEEEDESEDQELVPKHPNMVCYLHVPSVMFQINFSIHSCTIHFDSIFCTLRHCSNGFTKW